MDTIDLVAYALGALIVLGILAGFFFYLRTAYRAGGWRRVGRDLGIAVAALEAVS